MSTEQISHREFSRNHSERPWRAPGAHGQDLSNMYAVMHEKIRSVEDQTWGSSAHAQREYLDDTKPPETERPLYGQTSIAKVCRYLPPAAGQVNCNSGSSVDCAMNPCKEFGTGSSESAKIHTGLPDRVSGNSFIGPPVKQPHPSTKLSSKLREDLLYISLEEAEEWREKNRSSPVFKEKDNILGDWVLKELEHRNSVSSAFYVPEMPSTF